MLHLAALVHHLLHKELAPTRHEARLPLKQEEYNFFKKTQKNMMILPEEPKKDEDYEKNKDCDLMKGDGTKLLFLLLQNFPDCPLVSKLDRISGRE